MPKTLNPKKFALTSLQRPKKKTKTNLKPFILRRPDPKPLHPKTSDKGALVTGIGLWGICRYVCMYIYSYEEL